ncbi:hypothetical protein M5689_011130 [Euphorbia peplus]|nr:hypothetical protein M5689_011130 [Euphorbia peplus]
MEGEKWEGKMIGEVKGVPGEHVWGLLADFCNVQKLMPNISKCVKAGGEDGKPGLIREFEHCVTSDEPQVLSADVLEKENGVVSAQERLLEIDEKERCFRYELLDNNIGVQNYEAGFKVMDMDEGGCKIEWSFACDPIGGMTIDDLKSQRTYLMEGMIHKIQSDFSPAS